MDETNYKIIPYEQQYHFEVLRLLVDLWGEDIHLSNAYFEWKYLNNPYVQSPYIYLVFFDDKLVGVRSFCVTHWQVGNPGHSFLCLTDADTVIHPDFRRKGVFSIINNYAMKELLSKTYNYIITLSANRGSAAAVLKMGWKNVGFIQTAYYSDSPPKNKWEIFRKIIRRIPVFRLIYRHLRREISAQNLEQVTEGSTFDKLDINFKKIKSKNKLPIFVTKDPICEAMTEFVEKLCNDGRIRHVRDRNFFSWRYKNPRSEYRFLYWGDEEKIDGYITIRSRGNKKDGKVMIVDWEAVDHEISRQLLNASIKLGEFNSISTWSETLSLEKKNLLIDCGFKISTYNIEENPTHFPPVLLIKNITDNNWKIENCNMLEIHNWDLRPIYSDGI
jgi:hypothetical protein